MKKDMDWYIYEPMNWQKRIGYTVDESRCRYQVPEGGRSVGFRQCSRKAVDQVGGYGFCKQHAAVVRKGMGLE